MTASAEEEQQAKEAAAADEVVAAELQSMLEQKRQAAAEEEACRQAKHDAFIAELEATNPSFAEYAAVATGEVPHAEFRGGARVSPPLRPRLRHPQC